MKNKRRQYYGVIHPSDMGNYDCLYVICDCREEAEDWAKDYNREVHFHDEKAYVVRGLHNIKRCVPQYSLREIQDGEF